MYRRAIVAVGAIFLAIFLGAGMVAHAAVAERRWTVSPGSSSSSSSGSVTTGDLVLYVDPTGSDSNVCTASGSGACLTINGALGKVPQHIRHNVTVNVAAGTYGAFQVSDFVMGYNSTLAIVGTFSTATVATGNATGTATAGTAGSSTTPSFGTLTDSTQTWTVNNLAGKFVETLSGTGSGQYRLITSNTATALTIAGTWTAPGAGTTYAIRDLASIVNTGASSNVYGTGLAGGSSAYAAGFWGSVGASASRGEIVVRRMRIAPPSGTSAVFVGPGARIQFLEDAILNAGASVLVNVASFGVASLVDTYLNPAGSFGGISTGNGPFIGLVRCWMTGGTTQASANVSTQYSVSNSYFNGFTTSALAASGSNATIQLTGSIIDGSGGGGTVCVDSSISSFNYFSGGVGGTGNSISNCAIGVRLDGTTSGVLGNAWIGSTNAVSFSVLNGARLRISTGTAMTGTTEISLDGTSVPYATLRALSPKRFTDLATLSSVWEP